MRRTGALALAFVVLLGALAVAPKIDAATAASADPICDVPTRPAHAGANWTRPPLNDTIAPAFAAWSPTGFVPDLRPVLRLAYRDNCAVDPENVTILVDGEAVSVAFANGTYAEARPGSALTVGPHLARARIQDAAENSREASWTFRVLPPPVAGRREAVGLAVVEAGSKTKIAWSDPAIAIAELDVAFETRAVNVTAIALEHASLPGTVPSLPVASARILEYAIDAEEPPAMTSAELTLRVSPAWISARGDLSQVVFFTGNAAGWRALPVEHKGASGGSERFLAEVPGPGIYAFGVDAERPTLQALEPEAGVILTRAPERARVRVHDNLPLGNGTSTFSIDGDRLEARLLDGNLSADLASTVPDGRHLLSATYTDGAGNTGEVRWSFLIDRAGPEFPSVSPEGPVTALRPQITVVYVDAVSGVDPSTVRVALDGADVLAHARVTGGSVTVTPPENLTVGSHVLAITAHDRAGNERSFSHVFDVKAPTPSTPLLPIAALGLVALGLRSCSRGSKRSGPWRRS